MLQHRQQLMQVSLLLTSWMLQIGVVLSTGQVHFHGELINSLQQWQLELQTTTVYMWDWAFWNVIAEWFSPQSGCLDYMKKVKLNISTSNLYPPWLWTRQSHIHPRWSNAVFFLKQCSLTSEKTKVWCLGACCHLSNHKSVDDTWCHKEVIWHQGKTQFTTKKLSELDICGQYHRWYFRLHLL